MLSRFKYWTYTKIVCLIPIVFLTGCPTILNCENTKYNFNVSAFIKPTQEFFNVGDTLYFDSYTSTNMKDIKLNKDVLFEKAVDFGTTLGVVEIRKDTIIGAVNNFTFFALDGQAWTDPKYQPSRIIQVKYKEYNKKYNLKIGFICQKKGIYMFGIGATGPVTQPHKSTCEGATITISIDNIDKHLHYYQNLYYHTVIPEKEQKAAYCFTVE